MTVLIVWSQKKNNCLKYWFFNNPIIDQHQGRLKHSFFKNFSFTHWATGSTASCLMAKTNITNTIQKTRSSVLKSKSPPETPRSGHTPMTRLDDVSPKNAKTNLPGRAPNRNAPTSSGTERDYFRSTPTKAATPIFTPTKTATNPQPKSSATTKTKRNTSPISTTTKSAYRTR